MIKIGASGNSISFYEEGYTSTIDTPKWLRERNLDLFEYSFGRGITISSKTAEEIGAAFKKEGIELSAHAPYYINYGNPDELMIEKSHTYVLTSLKMLKAFGGDRLVVHIGSYGKQDKEKCFLKAVDNLHSLIDRLSENGFNQKICFETMGKLGQIGSLDEIITVCNMADNFYPCVDFGHLNSREQGALKTKNDFDEIVRKMLDNMPIEKVLNMHVHFSKIEYGAKGEIRHLTFADDKYGPSFEPFAETIMQFDLTAHILCESNGTQAEDAMFMKNYLKGLTG